MSNDNFAEKKSEFLENMRISRQIPERKNYRLSTIMATFSAASFSLGILLAFFHSKYRIPVSIINALLLFGPSLFVIYLIFDYLKPSANSFENNYFNEKYRIFQHDINQSLLLNTWHEELSKDFFSDAKKAEMLAEIQERLETDVLQESLEKIRSTIESQINENNSEKLFKKITGRLSNEVQDLARRGNLNPILGIVTTLAGLAVLGYTVLYSRSPHSLEYLLVYFIPRISLVFLIEIFAYFFLKLYKQSLSEIKYFQNEITNVESKQIAIHLATRTKDYALLTRAVEELLKTERNFILSKNQTTVDLERERISQGTYTKIANAIKELIKKNNE